MPHAQHHEGQELLGRAGQQPMKDAQRPMKMQPGAMSCPCPGCQLGQARGKDCPLEMRMKKAGVPQEMIERARMAARTKIHPADPQALLTLKDELNLTDQQVQELRNIIDSAQERALGILSEEQWDKVRQFEPQTMSMMDIHCKVMPIMHARRQDMMGNRGGMMGDRGGMMGGRGGMMGGPMQQKKRPYGRPGMRGAERQPMSEQWPMQQEQTE